MTIRLQCKHCKALLETKIYNKFFVLNFYNFETITCPTCNKKNKIKIVVEFDEEYKP